MELDELEWEEVESSNISAIAFHAESQRICVRFKDDAVWAYDDCPKELFERFRLAPSVGKFFHANIKNSHASERL